MSILSKKLQVKTPAPPSASNYLAVTSDVSPYLIVYPWSSSGFGTKFSNPISPPSGPSYTVAFSPSGAEIAVALTTSPYVTAYSWSSSGFGTRLSNPSTLPPSTSRGVAFI